MTIKDIYNLQSCKANTKIECYKTKRTVNRTSGGEEDRAKMYFTIKVYSLCNQVYEQDSQGKIDVAQ